MKNSLKAVWILPLLCSVSFAWASPVQEKASAVAQESRREALSAQKAAEWNVHTLKASWQRCEMYVSRSRGSGKRVRVAKPWSCEEVTASCGAVVSEGKVFASAACFYPSAGKEQKINLKQALLIFSKDKQPVRLTQFLGKVKDLVVFALD